MKRKLSLLLAVVLAMTMVMGVGVTAFAADAYSLYQYAMPMINNAKSGQTITFEFGE